KVAELAIEEISDCCRIEILDKDRDLNMVVLKHNNYDIISENHFADFGNPTVIENGESVFHPVFRHKELGNCSLMMVPLIIHGRSLGSLSLLYKDSRHKYDQGHLKIAEELGRRIAMALENSLLYNLSLRAIEVRNDFLSIASHELKTPITSLKLQLQMAQRNLNSIDLGQTKRFTESIGASLRQVDRLTGLIHVLLDVSKIQSGKFFFSFDRTTVSDVVQEVLERNKEVFSNSNCELHVSNIPDISVVWDKVRIEQVILNLLMNAAKYAPGKIELNVTEKEGTVEIEVRDFGKGIQMEKIKSIFDRFTRASCDSIAGMGLCLFIVKQIVEGHKRIIDVESSDKGSVFKVSLPMIGNGILAGVKEVETSDTHLL